MEHREYRSCSDTGAQQNNSISWPQREGSSRRAHLENVANADMIVQERTGHTVLFLFDAHAISICAWPTRHRIVPQNRLRIRFRPEPQDEELARQPCR